jgi:hypothetical protein
VRFVAVAVPIPQLDALTYRVPDGVPMPPVGARVRVPIGTRVVTGCVVGPAEAAASGVEAKDLLEVLDETPFIPAAGRRAVRLGGGLLHGRPGRCRGRGVATRREGARFVLQDATAGRADGAWAGGD